MDHLIGFFVRAVARLVEISGYFWQLGFRKCIFTVLVVVCLTAIVVRLAQRGGSIHHH